MSGRPVFLATLGVVRQPEARLLSLFAYENTAVAGWLDALAADSASISCWCQRAGAGRCRGLAGCCDARAGACHQRGSLQISIVPFMTQDEYDLLLWSCDFNAVRGEVVHPCPVGGASAGVAHLSAGGRRALGQAQCISRALLAGLSPAAGSALRVLACVERGKGAEQAWSGLLGQYPTLLEHAETWTHAQVANGDLAGKLVFLHRLAMIRGLFLSLIPFGYFV